MVNTNFWIKADGLGIDVFLLCSLILSLFKKKKMEKRKLAEPVCCTAKAN